MKFISLSSALNIETLVTFRLLSRQDDSTSLTAHVWTAAHFRTGYGVINAMEISSKPVCRHAERKDQGGNGIASRRLQNAKVSFQRDVAEQNTTRGRVRNVNQVPVPPRQCLKEVWQGKGLVPRKAGTERQESVASQVLNAAQPVRHCTGALLCGPEPATAASHGSNSA